MNTQAAVSAAAIVAVPGLLDLVAIPETNPARKVALGHMSLMVLVLGVFVANLALGYDVLVSALDGSMTSYRGYGAMMPLALSGVGLALAVCGRAIGFVLAARYHVGEAPTSPPTRSVTPRFR